MQKQRTALIISLIILGLLIAVNGYFLFERGAKPDTSVRIFKHEVAEVGKEVMIGFKIVNNEYRDINYTYSVSFNLTKPRLYNDEVLVPKGKSFEYVLKFTVQEESVIQVSIEVYRGEELIEDSTFFTKVGSPKK